MTQNLSVKKNKYDFLDLMFLVLMIITSYYTRNVACQVMMVAFCGMIGIVALLKGIDAKHTWYFFGMALFIAYGYWGANYGPELINKTISMTMVVSLVLNLVMVYAICQYIQWKDDPEAILRVFELSIFLTAIIVLIASADTLATGRLGKGTMMNANRLAILSVYGIILCMYFANQSKKTKLNWFKIVFYVAIVLLTGSRKGIILIIISVFLVNLIRGGNHKIIKNVWTVGIVTLTLYLLIMNVPVLYNIIGVRIENLINLLAGNSTEESSLLNRQELIEVGWEYVKQHPWVGYGLDSFKIISDIDGSGQYHLYSHNNYVELMFGGGIIGTVLYYVPMIGILVGLIKNLKTHPCITYVLAIFIAKHTIEYAYVSYYERVDAYIIGIILGCLLWCRKKEVEEGEKENAINRETFEESI